MTRQTMTGSDAVVRAIRDLGGRPCRRDVLDVVAQVQARGYRDAVSAVAIAELLGRIERVLLTDGRVGLALTDEEARR